MDLNLFKELQEKYPSHPAEVLETGDRVIATIRHKTDGSKNIHNADLIVIENRKQVRHIRALWGQNEYLIPYNDLKIK
jgi:hypothetical protein